jgi:hypothetical protein
MTIIDDRAIVITEPGVYDIPADVYHADPTPSGSLSCSGARLLLPPNCPALFKHRLDNPAPPKRTFDLGHAAHKLVLGTGPELVVVDANDWRTNAAKAQRDQAYEDGAVPLLVHEHDQVEAMAAALRRHPIAGAMFNPDAGRAEQSLFWFDKQAGVWRRARLDWLPDNTAASGRLIIPDYKTTARGDLESIRRSINNYGYHQQSAWYQDAAVALDLAPQAAFAFVFQEKTAPYLVTVVEVDANALYIGRELNRKALDTYRRCSITGRWPGYADDDIALVALPTYAEIQHDQAAARGEFDLTETQ